MNNINDDAIYTLTLNNNQQQQQSDNNIVAALRLTKSKNDHQYTFLRSMCVSREHRRHGLATRLFTDSLRAFRARHCYCFASPELQRFYQKLGFVLADYEYSSSGTEDAIMKVDELPKWMIHSFESMVKRNQHKELRLYVRHHVVPSLSSSSTSTTTTTSSSSSKVSSSKQKNSTQIILLQHHTEQSKNTATGWLLNDTLYTERFGTTNNITSNNTNDDLNSSLNDDLNSSTHNDKLMVEDILNLSIWIWNGTNDVAMIEEQIDRLVHDENRMVYLLWTGGATTTTNSATATTTNAAAATTNEMTIEQTNNSSQKQSAKTFIIIDGTWQQAKKIYRKIPKLWSLPRISFSEDVPPSKYVLRGDYSGWRERFGGTTTTTAKNDDRGGSDGGNGRNNLLCTAEVAAAIMDRCGEGDCADVIRSRLDVFQSTFSHNTIIDSR